MVDGGPYEAMQHKLRRQPLRVMDADELYELASVAMKDRDLHHPGFCRRPTGVIDPLLDDDSTTADPEAPVLAEHERCPAAGRFSRCNLRCDMGYWHAHGNVVGQLMARLARRLGKDPNLYMATGVLHALDMLSHPHDRDSSPGDAPSHPEGHPLPLLERLVEFGAPRSMLLAILEYMPSTGLVPSGLLSHALRVCDAMATCFEAEVRFPLVRDAAELAFLLEARDELRFPRHAVHEIVEASRVRSETAASCRVLAVSIAEKDVLRARREATQEAARHVREALRGGAAASTRPGGTLSGRDEPMRTTPPDREGKAGARGRRPPPRERETGAE